MNWIPVGDRVPTHNYTVLAHVIGGPFVFGEGDTYITTAAYIREAGGWVECDGEGDVRIEVSHWMDLPQLPTKDAPTTRSDTDLVNWMEDNLRRDAQVMKGGVATKTVHAWQIVGHFDSLRETVNAAMDACA